MVNAGTKLLIDVGTDHAYLPIYLLKNNLVNFIFAVDRLKGPLLNAKKNIEKYGLKGRASFFLSNGLESVQPQSSGTVVMAGIGAENIVNIIKKANWLKNSKITLILQPMTKEEILREFLAKSFFKILEEKFVIDAGKVYVVFKVRFSSEDQSHLLDDPNYLFLGNSLSQAKTEPVEKYINKQPKRKKFYEEN